MSCALPVGTKNSGGREWDHHVRRLAVSALIAVIVLQPAFHLLRRPLTGVGWFQLTGAVVLAGLAERVRYLGGDLAAGTVQPHGFRLRVVVPFGSEAS
jgi:hypothetical protein